MRYQNTGIPGWLVYLENTLYNKLYNDNDKKYFVINFLTSLNPKINYNEVKRHYLIFILNDCLNSLNKLKETNEIINSKKVVSDVKYLLENNVTDKQQLGDAADAAYIASKNYNADIVSIASAYCAAFIAHNAYEAYDSYVGHGVSYATQVTGAISYNLYANKLIELMKKYKQ